MVPRAAPNENAGVVVAACAGCDIPNELAGPGVLTAAGCVEPRLAVTKLNAGAEADPARTGAKEEDCEEVGVATPTPKEGAVEVAAVALA